MADTRLFAQFAAPIQSASAEMIIADPTLGDRLLLERSGRLSVYYAPFCYVNQSARIVIVGITPGAQQAMNAVAAARRELLMGRDFASALAAAKVFASFSGAMRSNLVSMLDFIGVARWLGIETTDVLWATNSSLAHFTSALRYPVFADGANYSGNPSMLHTPLLRRYVEEYLSAEAKVLTQALWVPLGPKATEATHWLVAEKLLHNDQVLAGLPHPSGANAERILYFLYRKRREALSRKTDPDTLDKARAQLTKQVAVLSGSKRA